MELYGVVEFPVFLFHFEKGAQNEDTLLTILQQRKSVARACVCVREKFRRKEKFKKSIMCLYNQCSSCFPMFC